MIDGWRIYKHALFPTTAPFFDPDIEAIKNKKAWGKKVYLVKYTTNFDCANKTNWWWVLKDDPMDISKLNSKRRYDINKGLKNYLVKKFEPQDYAEQMYSVYYNAYQRYKKSESPLGKETFIKNCSLEKAANIEYYGAFDIQTNELSGYSKNYVYDSYVELSTIKYDPQCLQKQVSAALIYVMLCDYLNTRKKKYIFDGERSIRHATNFQDYLIKAFGFRRAYCRLHVEYKFFISIAIKFLYPLRKIICLLDNNAFIHNISSILSLEEIRRSSQ